MADIGLIEVLFIVTFILTSLFFKDLTWSCFVFNILYDFWGPFRTLYNHDQSNKFFISYLLDLSEETMETSAMMDRYIIIWGIKFIAVLNLQSVSVSSTNISTTGLLKYKLNIFRRTYHKTFYNNFNLLFQIYPRDQ